MASSDQSFPNYLTTVNVANFVSVKLSGNKRSNNYPSWKRQILCLIEATDLVRFIDGTIPPPNPEADSVAWRTDRVVLGWILGSLADTVVRMVAHAHLDTARVVWEELDKKFGEVNTPPPQVPQAVETENEEQLPMLLRMIRQEEWNAAKEYIITHTRAIRDQKTKKLDTCLHLAVSVNKPYALDFVRFLGDRMTEQTWQAQNIVGENALHTAVWTGNDSATEFLLDEFSDLMHVRNNNGELPIHLAIQGAKEGSVWLLLGKMGNVVDTQTGFKLLCMAIDAEHFYVAQGLIDTNPQLVYMELRDGTSIFQKLALKDNADRKRFSFWECFLLAKDKNSSVHHCKKNDHVLLVESLFKCLKGSSFSKTVQIYKDAMFTAVENRSEMIFNEVYQIFNDNQFEFSKLEDAYGNTPLHLVARLAPPHKLNLVSGAALQMQREIQWFKVRMHAIELTSPMYNV
ncbi:Unknown protein [Striga hermonthica]|uniref:Uncharacterized protein n=1 Tax=Striga hermonthica TaxID=68872 RepID=A0A9N7P2A1_STRHE|nr:Unknown protein [Striga hermonthica]